MPRVTHIEVRAGHRLWVEFNDGVRGEVDLSAELWGPLGEPLRDEAAFARAAIDEFGAVGWPGGFDLAPDALHAELSGRRAPTGTDGPRG
jgi:uncharacterized protein DUF2442